MSLGINKKTLHFRSVNLQWRLKQELSLLQYRLLHIVKSSYSRLFKGFIYFKLVHNGMIIFKSVTNLC